MRKNLIGFLLIAMFLSIIWAGCNLINVPSSRLIVVTTTPYGPLSGEPDGKIGDKVAAWDYYLTVTNFEKASLINQKQPKTGNKYVAIELEVESRVDSFDDFNSSYARLQDTDGNVYFRILAGKEPWLPAQYSLTKGSQVKGWVTFEVPENVHGLWLIYQSFQQPENKHLIIDLMK